MKKTILMTLAVALFGVAATPTEAANFSFTGALSGDDDHDFITFVVGAPSVVTVRSWSYAGGTNAAGASIPRGGFDPILALYAGTGGGAVLVAENDDGGFPLVDPDAVTGAYFDTYLTAALAPGTYTVAVSQYAAFAAGPTLGAGFGPSGTTGFHDVTGDRRTANWAFDVLNVERATVSTPDGGSSLLLLSLATGTCAFIKRKSKKA